MIVNNIVYRRAVRDKIAVKAPFFSEQIIYKAFGRTATFIIHSVVCAHNAADLCLFDGGFKCRNICFVKILFAHFGIKGMSLSFGTAVGTKVLGAGRGFQIFIVITLNPLNKSATENRRQIRILTVGFVPPAPSRISENIYIRRPERETFINTVILIFLALVEFCPRLGWNNIGTDSYGVLIKGWRHAYCLRKYGCNTCSCNAVQALVPPVILLDVESVNSLCRITHLRS